MDIMEETKSNPLFATESTIRATVDMVLQRAKETGNNDMALAVMQVITSVQDKVDEIKKLKTRAKHEMHMTHRKWDRVNELDKVLKILQ